MKKVIFMSLAAAAMMTSCSNDEAIETPKQNAIGFSSFVNKSTRGAANDITGDNIENFAVYGFIGDGNNLLFKGDAVTKSGSVWTCNNTQFWVAGQSYWFFAIAPNTEGHQWTYTPGTNINGGSIGFTNGAGTEDLLWAKTGQIDCDNPVPATPDKVEFEFNHLLSRVKFAFTNDMGNSQTKLVVRDVKITNAGNQATCDVSGAAPAWAAPTSTTNLDFGQNLANGSEAKILNTQTNATDHKYMIPTASNDYKLTFTVDVYYGDAAQATQSYTHTGVSLPSTDMQCGYSYVFTATLNGENIDPDGELKPIEFNVTSVETWEDDNKKEDVTIPMN